MSVKKTVAACVITTTLCWVALAVVLKPTPAEASSRQDTPVSACVDGILHYKWFAGRNLGLFAVTVAVNPDGKPRTCSN